MINMILTQKQIDWVNSERETIKRIMESQPNKGIIRWAARQEALHLIIQLHNMEVSKNGES